MRALALTVAVLAAAACGGSDDSFTLADCVEGWNAGSEEVGIPGIAASPGPYAGAKVNVQRDVEEAVCVVSLENDLGGWYQLAYPPAESISEQNVREVRSGSFQERFAAVGEPNAVADASGQLELSFGL